MFGKDALSGTGRHDSLTTIKSLGKSKVVSRYFLILTFFFQEKLKTIGAAEAIAAGIAVFVLDKCEVFHACALLSELSDQIHL